RARRVRPRRYRPRCSPRGCPKNIKGAYMAPRVPCPPPLAGEMRRPDPEVYFFRRPLYIGCVSGPGVGGAVYLGHRFRAAIRAHSGSLRREIRTVAAVMRVMLSGLVAGLTLVSLPPAAMAH